MHGREAICTLDLLADTQTPDAPSDVNQYAEELVNRLKAAFRDIASHTGAQVERMKRNYNANVRQMEFNVNQLVWYYYPRRYQGRSPKWSRFYIGPYRVEKALNDVNCVIRKTPRSRPIRPVIVHVGKLRPYYGQPPLCWKMPECRAGD